MTLDPMTYRVLGEDDYMLEIEVDAQGGYYVNSGDYASHAPRRGHLSESQRASLGALVERLGAPREHPAPEGASGFVAELKIGQGEGARVYRFWEGALGDDPSLMALVRGLEVI